MPTGYRGRGVLTLEQLRELAERLPEGAALTLPRAVLLEALAGITVAGPIDAPAELTVAELAGRFHRSPSTVRGWLEAGRFPGAFKLNGRDWRVPAVAVEAFIAQSRPRALPGADLGAWRTRRRPA